MVSGSTHLPALMAAICCPTPPCRDRHAARHSDACMQDWEPKSPNGNASIAKLLLMIKNKEISTEFSKKGHKEKGDKDKDDGR